MAGVTLSECLYIHDWNDKRTQMEAVYGQLCGTHEGVHQHSSFLSSGHTVGCTSLPA